MQDYYEEMMDRLDEQDDEDAEAQAQELSGNPDEDVDNGGLGMLGLL